MIKLLSHVLLPLFVFSFLAFTAIWHLFFNQSLVQAGLQSKLEPICIPRDMNPHPYRLAYTNIRVADHLLCVLVVFFHTLMDLAYRPFLATLFSVVGVVTLFLFLEAARDRGAFLLRFPTAVGILFQRFSMAVVMPLYTLLFIITGNTSIQPSIMIPSPPSKINQGNAEALLFGLLLGYVVPTALMLRLGNPVVTAVWQIFPILVALAIFLHKVIRPPSRHNQSGHLTVIATLGFTFVLSTLLHVVYVWPVLVDTATLRTMFVPVGMLDPESASLTDVVLEFIQWDLIFGTAAVMLATFWMADSVLLLAGTLVWYCIATIPLGPAAAITGVFIWREIRLNGRSQVERTPQKLE